MSIEVKGMLLGLVAAVGLLGVTFGLSPLFQPKRATDANREPQAKAASVTTTDVLQGDAKRGYRLFDHTCAPCHGDDARGDEGPNLHGLTKSDARITTIIKGGVKGEMPSFAKKFSDADVQALIAYLRTLKD
ncbi:MAG TPA: cytochrome c [Candidatus Binatia bacterium]|jgi:mono/diheme cytochrome c family protein|nr:cytochrome c [Candidatus Binatia bacterium]